MRKPGLPRSQSRRIEQLRDFYGRSPTVNELRGLAALPIRGSKQLNDTSEKGNRIDQLLRKCYEDHDWTVLEEAGQLLWEQIFNQPEPDEIRCQSIEYLPTLSDDLSLDDSSSESESPEPSPGGGRNFGARPAITSRSVKTRKRNQVHHQTTTYTGSTLPHIMNLSKSQTGYLLRENFPIRGPSFRADSFQSNSGAIGQGYPTYAIGQERYQHNPPRDIVLQSQHTCPYALCKRSKNSPFKTAENLATHIRKYHNEDGVKEREATKTFNKAVHTTNNAEGVGNLEVVATTGGMLSNVKDGVAFADSNVREELRDLRSEQTELKGRLQDTANQSTGLMHQINQLERQQNHHHTLPAYQQSAPTWPGNQAHLRPFNNQPLYYTWPEAPPQPNAAYQAAWPPAQTQQNGAYHQSYVPAQGNQAPSGFAHQQPVSTWSGVPIQSNPSADSMEKSE